MVEEERITIAAGGIIWRTSTSRTGGVEILLIHRPTYDDWTFPKGKVDPGETLQQTAVREIAEETGLTVRLGHPLPRVSYEVSAGLKHVRYWCAQQLPGDDVAFTPNKEVDRVAWVSVLEAAEQLSYGYDRDLLSEFVELAARDGHRTRTLVVLRHGKAVARGAFDGPDLERPLAAAGASRAHDLIPLLTAYGVRRVVSSPAVRCTETVAPYAGLLETDIRLDDALSEDTNRERVGHVVDDLISRKKPAVLCSHRPTLPWVLDAAGVAVVDLAPGEGVVVHHRKGRVLHSELLPSQPST